RGFATAPRPGGGQAWPRLPAAGEAPSPARQGRRREETMGGWYQRILWTAAVLPAAAALLSQSAPLPRVAEASNMQVIGHSDLNGAGKGGEGLALRQYPDGRRMLFLAHESAPMCFSVIDVTRPEDPKVVAQVPVEEAFVRCNSLGLSGTTL